MSERKLNLEDIVSERPEELDNHLLTPKFGSALSTSEASSNASEGVVGEQPDSAMNNASAVAKDVAQKRTRKPKNTEKKAASVKKKADLVDIQKTRIRTLWPEGNYSISLKKVEDSEDWTGEIPEYGKVTVGNGPSPDKALISLKQNLLDDGETLAAMQKDKEISDAKKLLKISEPIPTPEEVEAAEQEQKRIELTTAEKNRRINKMFDTSNVVFFAKAIGVLIAIVLLLVARKQTTVETFVTFVDYASIILLVTCLFDVVFTVYGLLLIHKSPKE